MKVQLAERIEIRVVTVELPDACPCCEGQLDQERIRVSTYTDRAHSLGDADCDGDSLGDDIEAPVMYQCDSCGASLAQGAIEYVGEPTPLLQSALLKVADHERCSDECRGWAHFNIGEDREHIERCDECGVFADDEAAAVAHAKHCSCGADADRGCQRCHSCARSLTSDAEAAHHTYGVAPRYYWNEQIYCSVACAAQQGADARDVVEQL